MIEAEPALGVCCPASSSTRRCSAIADFVDLKSPYTLGHARAVADLARPRRGSSGCRQTRSERCAAPGLVHDLGRLGVSNSIWDKRGPLGAGEWERVRMHPYLTERMLHQSEALAPLGRDRRAAPRAARRLGLPARAVRRRRSPGRPGSSAPPTPTRRCASRGRTGRRCSPTRRPPSCAPRSRRDASTRDAVEAVLGAAGHRVVAPPRGTGRADRARGRRPAAARARAVEQGDRRSAW